MCDARKAGERIRVGRAEPEGAIEVGEGVIKASAVHAANPSVNHDPEVVGVRFDGAAESG